MNFIITIAFTIMGVILSLSKPRWGVIVILGMLYFPIFSILNLGPIETSVSTLPVLALFGNAFWKWSHNSREIKIASWQWLVIIGMFISLILATIVSKSPSRTWVILPNLILYILIIFSIIVLCRSRDDFVMISKAILAFVLLDALWPGLPPIQQFFGERAVGINGIVFKYYLAFAISIVLMLQPIPGYSKAWRFTALIVAILVIYRAIDYETRSAWLALIIIAILGFIRLPRRLVLLGILIFSIIVGVFFFRDIILNNAYETQQTISALQSDNREQANSGDRIRLVSVKFGWLMFQERPVIGWGPGVFSDLIRNYASGPVKYTPGGAFNSWLSLLVENGIFGLMPTLMAFIIPLVIIWINFNRVPTNFRYLAFALALGVVGVGVHLAFIDLMYTSQVWFHVGLAMAGAQVVILEVNVNDSSQPISDRSTTIKQKSFR